MSTLIGGLIDNASVKLEENSNKTESVLLEFTVWYSDGTVIIEYRCVDSGIEDMFKS